MKVDYPNGDGEAFLIAIDGAYNDAQKKAGTLNRICKEEKEKDPEVPVIIAKPLEWPGTPEEHAAAILNAKNLKEETAKAVKHASLTMSSSIGDRKGMIDDTKLPPKPDPVEGANALDALIYNAETFSDEQFAECYHTRATYLFYRYEDEPTAAKARERLQTLI